MSRTLKISVSSMEEIQRVIDRIDERLAILKLNSAEKETLKEQVLTVLQNALFRLSGRSEGLELHMKNVVLAGSGAVKVTVDCPRRNVLCRLLGL